MVKPCKNIVTNIQKYLPIFKLNKPLTGSNQSRQYNAEIIYKSKLWQGTDRILIEIGLREPHLMEPTNDMAKTLLTDPFSNDAIVSPFKINCLSQQEAYSEKMRAALTRQKLAIRDFYDIQYAISHNIINLHDKAFISLVQRKLSSPSNELIDFDSNKISYLKNKIDTELRPTLGEHETLKFDLNAVIEDLKNFAGKLAVQASDSLIENPAIKILQKHPEQDFIPD